MKLNLFPFVAAFMALFCMANDLQADEMPNREQQAAITKSDSRSDSSIKQNPSPFQHNPSEDSARQALAQAIAGFGHPDVSRVTLLDRFRIFVQRYPESQVVAQGREAVEVLQRMVEEDRAHAKLALKPLEQMSAQERAAELIFQLREQNGHQNMHPGSCNIFEDPRGERSPADQLVKMGLAAIPQLIEHLDDQRFTRSVGSIHHMRSGDPYDVLRVGDAVLIIVERIAYRNFGEQDYFGVAVDKGSQVTKIKTEVQSWWTQVEQQGEEKVLITGVERDDANSWLQVDALVKKYPDAAFQPIALVLRKTKSSFNRIEMVEALSKLKDEGVTALLKEELEQTPDLETRLVAAEGLWQRGDDDAVKRMILDWQRLSPDDQDENGLANLIGFLAGCGKVNAVEALATTLPKHTTGYRASAVLQFYDQPYWKDKGDGKAPPRSDDKALVDRAAERLIVQELLDTEQDHGSSMAFGNISFTSPRVCDIASFVLAQKWPSRYQFSNRGMQFEHDQQRIRLYNIWCAENGLPLHTTPQRVIIKPFLDNMMRALLQGVIEAPSAAKRHAAIAAIERRGLCTLAAVNRAALAPNMKQAVRGELQQLARRLANTVRQVLFDPLSVPPDSAFRAKLSALQGKPLTSAQFVDLLAWFTGKLRPGVHSIKLEAYRDVNGSGYTLTITLVPGSPSASDSNQQNSTYEGVTINAQMVDNCSVDITLGERPSYDFDAFIQVTDQALQASPYQSVLISASSVLVKPVR